MIRDLVERLKYRFELWRRDQREDWLGAGEATEISRDTSHYRDPRNALIITESTGRFALRTTTVFVGGIAVLSLIIYGLVATVWPSARHAADITMAVVGAVWIVGSGLAVLDMCIARRRHRDGARKEI